MPNFSGKHEKMNYSKIPSNLCEFFEFWGSFGPPPNTDKTKTSMFTAFRSCSLQHDKTNRKDEKLRPGPNI